MSQQDTNTTKQVIRKEKKHKMKFSSVVLLGGVVSIALAKNVVDLSKRDLKRIANDVDLKISEDELNNLFPNPFRKRSGIIMEPNLQVVEGSVEEINEKQRLFEQGVDVEVDKAGEQGVNGDEMHILDV